jgi:protein pelota
MDEVLKRIGSGGAVAYGKAEVRKAIDYGAAEEVLVSDTLIRDPGVARLLEEAERINARVVVFSSEFEPGNRLNALGGIAALLRYPLS